MKKYVDTLLNIDWAKAGQEVGLRKAHQRFEDDSREGTITVIFSEDGDAHIWVNPDIKEFHTGCRFRTVGGGGQSERVRTALMILAMAIKADNEGWKQERD